MDVKDHKSIETEEDTEDITGRRDEFGFCAVCYRVLTSNGTHQICCLPCGHIYGFSCIKTWLETGLSGKCLQCMTACTLKDVRLLNVTRRHMPDAAAADQIVADQKPSTRRFPYKRFDVLNKRFDVLKRQADVLGKQKVAMKRLTELLDLKAQTEKRAKSLEQHADAMGQDDALRRRVDALDRWADEYLRKADVFGRQADAFGRRA